jgi:tRNA A-37 threonylcarbamoyl transferase component Bud32/tetratricopeptide (TPR) repeat protein
LASGVEADFSIRRTGLSVSATEPHSTEIVPLVKALVDRYRVERELGAGGMATVYLAHDLKHEREVAIKVLHPELGAALGADRFSSEIRITARLQHPHILPLLDSGEAGGLLYYVMPFVVGGTLRARLERDQQLPVPEAVRIAKEVASALAYAHARGIIHRDIKPENILLGATDPGSPPPALLSDFGIARSLDAAARKTSTGVTLGTAAYMSPEQATAEPEIDGRSDIYSVGCVLYEMLAGEPPFTGPNARAILAKTLSDPVRPVRRLRDTVPPHVDAALMTALARTPVDRFPDAAAFVAALEGDVTHSGALGAVERPRARRWTTPRVAAVLVGALAVGAVAWATLRPKAASAAIPAVRVQRFTTLAGDTASAYLAATLQQDVTAALAGSRSARVFAMDSAKLASGYAVTAMAVRRPDSVEVRLTVSREPDGELVGTKVVRQPLGRAQILPELTANAILDLVGSGRRVATSRSTSTRDSVAYDLFLRGRYQTDRRTEASTQRAVSLFRAAVARDSSFAEGWAGLVRAYAQANYRGYRIPGVSSDSLVPLMVDASERALDADSTRSYVWVGRAVALREIEPTSRQGQIAALERAIALDSSDADAWYYTAMAWEDSLEPARAGDAFRHALRIDPTHRNALGFFSLHFMWARQYDSALAWGNIGRRIDPAHILIRQALGLTELIAGDTARAAEDFRTEMRVSNGPDEGFGRAGLADIAMRQGNRALADSLIRQTMAATDTVRPTVHDAAYLAWGLAAVGDKNRAIRLLGRYTPRADAHFQLHLQRDPLLDPLRSVPAFRVLLARKDKIQGPGS